MKREYSRKIVAKWNILFSYGTFLFSVLIGIIIVPYYLKYISNDLYGYWLASGSILTWIFIVDPGLSDVLNQKIAESFGGGQYQTIGKIVSSGFIFIILITFILMAAGLIFVLFLDKLLLINNLQNLNVLKDCFYFALIGTCLLFFGFSISAINSGLHSSVAIGVFNILSYGLSVIITFYLLLNNYGLYSIAYSSIFRGGVLSLLNIIYLFYRLNKESIRVSFDFVQTKNLFKNISYNFLGKSAGIIGNNIQDFLVARYLGGILVTNFVMTKKIPELSKQFYEYPFKSLLAPIASLKGEGNLDKIRKFVIDIFKFFAIILPFLFFVLLTFNKPFIELWIGGKYFLGTTYNLLIILIFLIGSSSSTLYYLLFSFGYLKESNKILIIWSMIFVPSAFIGITTSGLIGLLIGWLLSLISTIWYLPLKIIKVSKLHRTDILLIAQIFVINVVALLIEYYLFSFLNVSNWIGFIIGLSCFSIIYLTFILLKYKEMRELVLRILFKYIKKTG